MNEGSIGMNCDCRDGHSHWVDLVHLKQFLIAYLHTPEGQAAVREGLPALAPPTWPWVNYVQPWDMAVHAPREPVPCVEPDPPAGRAAVREEVFRVLAEVVDAAMTYPARKTNPLACLSSAVHFQGPYSPTMEVKGRPELHPDTGVPCAEPLSFEEACRIARESLLQAEQRRQDAAEAEAAESMPAGAGGVPREADSLSLEPALQREQLLQRQLKVARDRLTALEQAAGEIADTSRHYGTLSTLDGDRQGPAWYIVPKPTIDALRALLRPPTPMEEKPPC